MSNIIEIAKKFNFDGEVVQCNPYGSGHINATYLVVCQNGNRQNRYILQQINRGIFPEVGRLMDNINQVTGFLRQKIIQAGGNPLRETLTIVPTIEGKLYYTDENGDCFRGYLFITDSVSYDLVEKPEDFYHCGVAFGSFQNRLADFPAGSLYETIPNFHNTPLRYQTFCNAVTDDAYDRVKEVLAEIAFVTEREGDMSLLTDQLEKGRLPLRVTHNDTKLNNCMFDVETGKAICVIDLDTVMSGLTAYDFGDSIRFGAATAAEDERDLEKVHFSLPLYEAYTKGFLESCGKSLTQAELQSLPIGAKLMTLECGMRFLTDYLQGDIYFKTSRPGQNLDRCRTQFKLVTEMEQHWNEMLVLIEKGIRETTV